MQIYNFLSAYGNAKIRTLNPDLLCFTLSEFKPLHKVFIMTNFAARLERSSFCETKKRERKAGKAAQIILNHFQIILILHQPQSDKCQ